VALFWSKKQSAASVRDERACKKELIEIMKSAPDNPRAKEEVRREHFPDLPKKMFYRAWTAAIEEAGALKWRSPGPRKKAST